MSFFEPSPQPLHDEEDEYAGPPWLDEPPAKLGGALPLALIVGKSDRAAVVLQQALVYPEGMVLTLDAISPDEELLHAQFRMGHRTAELPDEVMRFGVEFADGRKATNLGFGFQPANEPSALLLGKSGSGGSGRITWRYGLWPLPTEDPFWFVCEWPAPGIPLTRTALDTHSVVAAAAQSRALDFTKD